MGDGKFSSSDFPQIVDFIISEYKRRKNRRAELERLWKDIDRQVRMEPNTSHKLTQGRKDSNKDWLPELELPLQAQTLEVLTSDADRMSFPDSGPWFSASSLVTDEYLEKNDLSAIIAGDKLEVPSIIDQDNVDKLVVGALQHFHSQYDYQGNWDLIRAEAFTYGTGVGRIRVVEKRMLDTQTKGSLVSTRKFPVLVPVSVKNVYLDDRSHNLMSEGYALSPAIIQMKTQNFEDIKIQAKKGNKDPKNQNGGWIAGGLKDMEPDDNGNVDIVEYEGDLVVSRQGPGSIIVPNALVTVVMGSDQKIIRFRLRDESESSYIIDSYHKENVEAPYATSPLMKGHPIQFAAVQTLSRVIELGALHVQPPVSYDQDDSEFAQTGGPPIYPGAKWPTIGDVKTHMIGDPSAMFNIYMGLLNQYADVTGVNAPRLGGQTVSHTTAFAKEAELSRGTIRTVDYIKGSKRGAMAVSLDREYRMGRKLFKKSGEEVYIEPYKGFVNLSPGLLPEKVVFKVDGAGGPQEEQVKIQRKIEALQLSLSMDQLLAQAQMSGIQTTVDIERAIHQVLREGGWTDVDAITRTEEVIEPTAQPEGVSGVGGTNFAPGAALQAFEE